MTCRNTGGEKKKEESYTKPEKKPHFKIASAMSQAGRGRERERRWEILSKRKAEITAPLIGMSSCLLVRKGRIPAQSWPGEHFPVFGKRKRSELATECPTQTFLSESPAQCRGNVWRQGRGGRTSIGAAVLQMGRVS